MLDSKAKWKQPWLLSVLCVACIPLFPEYISPLLAVCSLIAAGCDAKARHRSVVVGTLGKWIMLYIVYMAAGLLYSPHFFSTLGTWAMWLVMFTVYLSMTTVLINRDRIDTTLICISMIAGIIGLIGLFEYVANILGVPVSQQFWQFADDRVFTWLPLTLLPWSDTLRVASTFNNPNILAEYLVMVIPFAIHYSFKGKRTEYRLPCRLCVLAAAAAILFTYSRGCYFVLLIIVLIFCIANVRKITVLLMSAASVYLLIPDSVLARLCTLTSSDRSVSERTEIWKYGVESIKDHPLFGVGAGISNTWDMLLQAGVNAPHMHNIVLQLFAEGGAVAVAIMLMVFWKLFRGSLSMLHASKEAKEVGVMMLTFAVSLFIVGLFEFPMFTPKQVGIFVMGLALLDSILSVYLGRENSPIRSFVLRQNRPASGAENTNLH